MTGNTIHIKFNKYYVFPYFSDISPWNNKITLPFGKKREFCLARNNNGANLSIALVYYQIAYKTKPSAINTVD